MVDGGADSVAGAAGGEGEVSLRVAVGGDWGGGADGGARVQHVVCTDAAGAGAEHYGGGFVGAYVSAGDVGGVSAAGCAGEHPGRTGRAPDGRDRDGVD